MSPCDGPLRGVLEQVNSEFGWVCHAGPGSDVAVISTGRYYADSEPVEIFARTQTDGTFFFSDGGEILNRLGDGGFDLEDVAHGSIWRDTLREFRLSVADGTIHLMTDPANAVRGLARLADALLGLDTLRMLALPAVKRPRTFANAVEDYLRDRYPTESVVRHPTIPLDDGNQIRPTFRVQAKRGLVYVQATSATSAIQSYDHAFVTFSMAKRGGLPMEQRLVVLGGSLRTWSVPKLRVLSEYAYVGLWEPRSQIESFLDGNKPQSTLLIPDLS